jgi:hypothetical protein
MLEGLFSVWHSSISEDLVGIGHLKSDKKYIKELAVQSIIYNEINLSKIYLNFPKVINKYNPYLEIKKEEPVKQEQVNEEPVKQEPVKEEPVKQEPVNKGRKKVIKEPVNKEPVKRGRKKVIKE